MSMSTLDPGQVLKSAFDEATQSIRTELVSGGIAGTVSIKDGSTSNEATVNSQGEILTAIGDASTGTTASVTGANALKVDGSAVTQPVSAASLPLPTGAATSANQTTANTSLASIDSKTPSGLTVSSTRLLVDGSGITQPISQAGYTNVEFARNDYSSVNVTTSAYTQLIASTANTYQEIHISDTSGQTLKLATGAPASEVDKIIIPPGGTFPMKFKITAGTRISIKAISATANSGEIDVQFLG